MRTQHAPTTLAGPLDPIWRGFHPLACCQCGKEQATAPGEWCQPCHDAAPHTRRNPAEDQP